MLVSLCLLLPIYVVLFWGIFFSFDHSRTLRSTHASVMLSIFFICEFLLHFYRYCIYSNIPLPLYSSVIYHSANILIIPVFYMYILLLTEDRSFSISRHIRYLLPSIVWIVLFISVVSVIPRNEYNQLVKFWIQPEQTLFSLTILQWLLVLKVLLYIVQAILLIYVGIKKIHRYEYVTANYYSNIKKSIGYTAGNMLFVMVGLSIVTLMNLLIGMPLVVPDFSTSTLCVLKLSNAIVLFLIGYYAMHQNSRMVYLEVVIKQNSIPYTPQQEKNIGIKLTQLMTDRKIYRDPMLDVKVVSDMINVPIEHLLKYINRHYQLSFYSYINGQRFQVLHDTLKANPDISNQTLASICGYHSAVEMNRQMNILLRKNISEYRELIKE